MRNGAADLRERDFNDTVQSARVRSGYWEVRGRGFPCRCRMLGPGDYASLERLSNRISSVREVSWTRGWQEACPRGRLLLLVTIYCAFPILCYTVFSTDGYTDISCHVDHLPLPPPETTP